jgi:hypothetical protein
MKMRQSCPASADAVHDIQAAYCIAQAPSVWKASPPPSPHTSLAAKQLMVVCHFAPHCGSLRDALQLAIDIGVIGMSPAQCPCVEQVTLPPLPDELHAAVTASPSAIATPLAKVFTEVAWSMALSCLGQYLSRTAIGNFFCRSGRLAMVRPSR